VLTESFLEMLQKKKCKRIKVQIKLGDLGFLYPITENRKSVWLRKIETSRQEAGLTDPDLESIDPELADIVFFLLCFRNMQCKPTLQSDTGVTKMTISLKT